MIGRTTQRGGIAPMFLVDAEFAGDVCERSWCNAGPGGYLCSRVGGKNVYLHRFVWQLKHGECPEMLDHINGARWDCRIENLRPATHSLNGLNRTTRKKTKHELPRGVKPEPRSKSNPFSASIQADGKRHYLGVFPTPESASAAYEKARSEEMARLATFAPGTVNRHSGRTGRPS